MNPRLLRFTIFSIALAMVGLVSIQVYWVVDAYKQRQQQFIESVFKAMNDVLYDYEKYRVEKQMQRLFDINQMQDKMVEYVDSVTMSKSTIKKGQDGQIEKITIENPRGLTNFFFSSGQYGFQDPFGMRNDQSLDMPTGSDFGLSQEDKN